MRGLFGQLVRALFRSYPLGRPFGIAVGVHGTLLALAALLVLSELLGGGLVEGIATFVLMVALFGSVALHELGHALAARSYGVPTRAITLLPIGGVAMLERELRRPRQELVVALAGPAVNVVIAALLLLADPLLSLVVAGTAGTGLAGFVALVATLLRLTFWINVMLFAFNLLPAFPMDGGRVLRALLAQRIGRLRATRIAARLGQGLAVVLGLLGLFGVGVGPIAMFVAVFVYLTASAELRRVEGEHAVSPFDPWGDRAFGRGFDGPLRGPWSPPGGAPVGFFRVVEVRPGPRDA